MNQESSQTNSRSSQTISRRQQMLLDKLNEEPDIRKAAAIAHIGRSTLYRWLKDPVFHSALHQKQNEIHQDTLFALRAYTRSALSVLKELLESPNEQLRLKAGNALLMYSQRYDIAAMK
jgi:hypothetical protein